MMALDTETTGVDFFHGAMPFFVSTCSEDGTQEYWEWTVCPYTRRPDISPDELDEVRACIDGAPSIVLQNAKFDAHALHTLGIEFPWNIHEDTLLAAHLLASNEPHDLTYLAKSYLDHDIRPLEVRLEKAVKKARDYCRRHLPDWATAREDDEEMPSAKKETWRFDYWLPRTLMLWWSTSEVPGISAVLDEHAEWWTILRDYSNEDTKTTLCLWHVMRSEIDRLNLWDQYHEARKLPEIFYDMERRGVTLHRGVLRESRSQFWQDSEEEKRVCRDIAAAVGYDLKLPKSGMNGSLTDFCFDHREVTCSRCGKTKSFPLSKPTQPCKRCSARGITPTITDRIVSNLGLPVVALTDTGVPSLDAKRAIPEYLATLNGEQLEFVRALASSRKYDKAIESMVSYEKFGLPYLSGDGDRSIEAVGYNVSGLTDFLILHPSNNQTATKTLRTSQSNPNGQQVCFDADTELLTDDGWVRADEIKMTHRVAQYWKQSGKIEFSCPNDVHHPHFKGDMHWIKTEQQIDMMLTPSHRCLLQNRRTLLKFTVQASEFSGDYLHFNAGRYVGGDVDMPESVVAWLCAVQADGNYQVSRREASDPSGDYGISFTFRKSRKVERMRWILNTIGANYTEKVRSNCTWFYVGKHEPIVVMARDLMPDKCFGSWLLSLDRQSLDIFTDEVFNWDGDFTRKASWSSMLKENSDWVQAVFALSGSRAMLSSRLPTKESTELYHTVNITHGKDSSLSSNFTRTLVPWDGPVHCVTVPSSYVVTRRNGKVSITGNSKQEASCPICNPEGDNEDIDPNCWKCHGTGLARSSIRKMFCPAPGREWWSADFENLELRIPAYKAPEPAMISLFERPNDPPYFGSNHLLVAHKLHPRLFDACLDKEGRVDGRVFKKRYKDTWYQYLKNGNFAVQYGCQEDLADSTYRVPGAFKMLKSAFAGMAALNQKLMDEATRYGYVKTALGYPLRVQRTDYGRPVPTQPLSYYVQGTAMECTRIAMPRCRDYLRQVNSRESGGYYMILLVHDEIVYDMPFRPDMGNLPVALELRRIMCSSGDDIGVPLTVNSERHDESWGKGETIKVAT